MPWKLDSAGVSGDNSYTVTTSVPIPGNPVQTHSISSPNNEFVRGYAGVAPSSPYVAVIENRLMQPKGTFASAGTEPPYGGPGNVSGTVTSGAFLSMNSQVYPAPGASVGTPALMSVNSGTYPVTPGSYNAFTETQFFNVGLAGAPQNSTQGGMRVWGGTFEFNNPAPASVPTHLGLRVRRDFAPAAFIPVMSLSGGAPGTVTYFTRFSQASHAIEKGSIYTPGSSTVYATSSDYRLKKDIAPLNNDEQLQKINQLMPREWKWTETEEPGIGFVAHEIQEVFTDSKQQGIVSGQKDDVEKFGHLIFIDSGEYCDPYEEFNEETQEFATVPTEIHEPSQEEKDALLLEGKQWVETRQKPVYQSMDSSFLVSPLVAAVQSLTAKVQALEARVTALESV